MTPPRPASWAESRADRDVVVGWWLGLVASVPATVVGLWFGLTELVGADGTAARHLYVRALDADTVPGVLGVATGFDDGDFLLVSP